MAVQQRLRVQLRLVDIAAGAALVQRLFGLQALPEGGYGIGSLRLDLVQGTQAPRHGAMDHLALRVPDVALALHQVEGRGGAMDRAVTDGLQNIAEFWDHGFDYVFVKGPEGARFELCTPTGQSAPWGFDHLGIACANLPVMRAFFLTQGFETVQDVLLTRANGETYVSFLRFGADMVELYSAPEHRARPQNPDGYFGLVLEGDFAAGEVQGPEGITLIRQTLIG